MLVLSRKTGERIVMPEQGLTITVVESRSGQVRLGITAPRSVRIFREEVAAFADEADGLALPPAKG